MNIFDRIVSSDGILRSYQECLQIRSCPIIQVLWDAWNTLECLGTQVCHCLRTITEGIEISLARHGNNFRSDLLLDASYVNDDDLFVDPVCILWQIRLECTRHDRFLRTVIKENTFFSFRRRLIAIHSFPESNIFKEYPTAFLLVFVRV